MKWMNLVLGGFMIVLLLGVVSAAYGSASVSVSASADSSVKSSDSSSTNNSDGSKGESVNDVITRINLRTGLDITASENSSLGEILRVSLSNGKYASVKVLPETASATAQAELGAKCEERNCTVELREVNVNGEARAVYNVKAEKQTKLLGIFNAQMNVEANVDAETGAVISTKKPWWSFLAKEE